MRQSWEQVIAKVRLSVSERRRLSSHHEFYGNRGKQRRPGHRNLQRVGVGCYWAGSRFPWGASLYPPSCPCRRISTVDRSSVPRARHKAGGNCLGVRVRRAGQFHRPSNRHHRCPHTSARGGRPNCRIAHAGGHRAKRARPYRAAPARGGNTRCQACPGVHSHLRASSPT